MLSSQTLSPEIARERAEAAARFLAEALRAKLLRLEAVVSQLALLAALDRSALSDLPQRGSAERGLQLGAEPADCSDFIAAIRRWLETQPT